MKAQFKYALRSSLMLRLIALAAVILLNLVFGLIGLFGPAGSAFLITAVVLSSMALCGIFVTNVIADTVSLKSVFGTPHGYLGALAPVKSRTVLLARISCIVCEDLAALFIGIAGVVLQSFILAGLIGSSPGDFSDRPDFGLIFSGAVIIILGYAYVITFTVFGAALKTCVFSGVRGKSLLSLAGVAASLWLLNLLNFTLVPFFFAERWGLLFTVGVSPGLSVSFAAYCLLALLRPAALFIASGELIERRIDLL